ncbi:MAG: NADH-quinone oxidoreductase subunit C [Pseudomonadota bacterium]
MSKNTTSLQEQLATRFDGPGFALVDRLDEVTLTVPRAALLETMITLRDAADLRFEQLIDLCGIDYMTYGERESAPVGERFAVVYHLLSLTHNQRLRVRTFVDDDMPLVDSVVTVWPGANWFEREAFDLFGIVFDGHPDLRRILTDYGFVGHPFRKDFPISGNVEMRYDEEHGRVVYEPVSIEPRINVPRVIRDDHRYAESSSEEGAN